MASACSDIFFSGSFQTQSGRNLDCDVTLSPVVASYPSKMDWTTTDSKGTTINLGKNKYSFVGVSVLGQEKKLVDGMNSEGFSASLLWMEDAKFPATAEGNSAMAMSDLVAWLLGNFTNVSDARKALSGKAVWYDSTVFPYPAHLVMHDTKRFSSVVVEWVGAAKPIYIDDGNGYNGALTNGPKYKTQLENLAHFKNLSMEPNQMAGLPGDQTSMSRFSRLSVLSKFAAKYVSFPDTLRCFGDLSPVIYGPNWCLQQILNLMDRVAIVHGESTHDIQDGKSLMHTQMTLVRDHAEKKIYYRFNTDVFIKMALVKKSLAFDKVQVLDSAANPKAIDAETARFSPSAFPVLDDNSDSLMLEISLPPTALGKDANPAKFYIFAKNADGRIMQWKPSKGWSYSREGRLLPLNGVNNILAPVHITLKDKFLMKHPGMKIFAGSGSSDTEMLMEGTFGQIFQTPDQDLLDRLPEVKSVLRSMTKTSKAHKRS